MKIFLPMLFCLSLQEQLVVGCWATMNNIYIYRNSQCNIESQIIDNNNLILNVKTLSLYMIQKQCYRTLFIFKDSIIKNLHLNLDIENTFPISCFIAPIIDLGGNNFSNISFTGYIKQEVLEKSLGFYNIFQDSLDLSPSNLKYISFKVDYGAYNQFVLVLNDTAYWPINNKSIGLWNNIDKGRLIFNNKSFQFQPMFSNIRSCDYYIMLAYDSVAVLLEDTFSYRVVYIYNETWICRSCDCVTIPLGEVFYKGRFLKSCPKDYFISVYHMCVVRCGTDDILINNSICQVKVPTIFEITDRKFVQKCSQYEIQVGGSCFKCEDNEYIVDGMCVPLQPGYCFSGRYYKGTCQQQCPFGYFGLQTFCVRNCPNFMVSFDGECRYFCPSGFHNLSQQCIIVCPEHTEIFHGQCLTSCPGDQYYQNQVKPGNCNMPTEFLLKGSCPYPYFLNEQQNLCVSSCENGTLYDHYYRRCVRRCQSNTVQDGSVCVITCISKMPIDGQCVPISCQPPLTYYNLSAQMCVTACNAPFYPRPNQAFFVCDTLMEHEFIMIQPEISPFITYNCSGILMFQTQKLCIQKLYCGELKLLVITSENNFYCIKNNSCPLGLFKISGLCVHDCGDLIMYKGECVLSCPDQMLIYLKGCVDRCPETHQLVHVSRCLNQCPDNLAAFKNQCLTKCPDRYYEQEKRCVIECNKNLLMDDFTRRCLMICPGMSVKFHSSCMSFEKYKKYFYNQEKATLGKGCFDDELLVLNNKFCIVKKDGCTPGLLQQGNLCTPGCFDNFMQQNGSCVAQCRGSGIISVDGLQCVDQCGPFQFQENGHCMQGCPVDQLATLSGECVSECPSPFYADQRIRRCVQTCPSGLFGDNFSMSCEYKCISGFADYLSHICVKQCQNLMFGDDLTHYCVDTCPNSYQQDLRTKTCVSKCALDQFINQANQCADSCPRYVDLKNGRCVKNCPNNKYLPGSLICIPLEQTISSIVEPINYSKDIFLQILIVVASWVICLLLVFILKV